MIKEEKVHDCTFEKGERQGQTERKRCGGGEKVHVTRTCTCTYVKLTSVQLSSGVGIKVLPVHNTKMSRSPK